MSECGSRHIQTRGGEKFLFFGIDFPDTQGTLRIELERFSRGLSQNVVLGPPASESLGILFTKEDC